MSVQAGGPPSTPAAQDTSSAAHCGSSCIPLHSGATCCRRAASRGAASNRAAVSPTRLNPDLWGCGGCPVIFPDADARLGAKSSAKTG